MRLTRNNFVPEPIQGQSMSLRLVVQARVTCILCVFIAYLRHAYFYSVFILCFLQINGIESVDSGYFVDLAVGNYEIVITDSRGCDGSVLMSVDPIPRMTLVTCAIILIILRRNYCYSKYVSLMLWGCNW